MRRFRTTAIAAITALVVGSGLGVASPAHAATTQIDVDLSQSTGPVYHGANGFLYGLGSEGVPTDTMLSGLENLGVAAQKAPDGLLHPTGDALEVAPQWKRNGGGDIQIYMQDIYTQFPYEDLGIEDYLEKVGTIVDAVMADPYRESYVYVPFNEPDLIWYGGDLAGLERDWKTVYEFIRAKDPDARIAGPGYSHYNAADYRHFLTFAEQNNVLPDVTTWHELQNSFFTNWYSNYEDYRDIENDLGIDPIPISINEYARSSGDLTVPGNLVQFISRFETSKVDGSLAYWHVAGTLDDLVSQNNRATGAWWLYRWYGLMSGNTVEVTLPDRNQSTQAIASYDSEAQQARVLLGGNPDVSGTYSADLTIGGLGGTPFSSNAQVTVWGVDASGTDPSVGPYVLSAGNVQAVNGSLQLTLEGLKGASAYYAVISPATAGSAPTTGRLEAEFTGLEGDAATAFGPVTGHSGPGFVEQYQGSSTAATSFFANAATNGYYDLSVHYSAGPATGADPTSRALAVDVNREPTTTVDVTPTDDWNTWRTATTRLYLPVGINQIDLVSLGDAVNLDYIELEPSPTQGAAVYEAEAQTLGGSAAVASDANASGGSLVGFVGNGSANTVTFENVTAPESGDYTLVFRYAQNEVGAGANDIVDRFADVSVNGQAPQQVAFANTRSWSTFWTASLRVHLDEGANTIEFGNDSAWAPNLDNLTVGRTADESSTEDGAAIVARHSGKCADVAEGSTADRAPIIQYTCGGQLNQQWRLEATGDGYYEIVSLLSGKCMDVEDGSTLDGARIVQWTCNGQPNQQWELRDAGDGYVMIVARHSGKCVDVPSSTTDDWAQLQQYSCWGGTNQQWSV